MIAIVKHILFSFLICSFFALVSFFFVQLDFLNEIQLFRPNHILLKVLESFCSSFNLFILAYSDSPCYLLCFFVMTTMTYSHEIIFFEAVLKSIGISDFIDMIRKST